MVGRDLADFYPERPAYSPGPLLLQIRNGGNRTLRGIDLSLHAGEILGVAGVEGSGKTALARAIFGDLPLGTGEMEIKGRKLDPTRPREAIEVGIGYLSDDRKREGLLLQQSLYDNTLLTRRAFAQPLRPPTSGGMSADEAERQLRQLDVRAGSFEQEARLLSGGNQQKVIIARWLAREPRILLLNDPTRGIDLGAKRDIYALLDTLAADGVAVVMLSTEVDEQVELMDRVLVFREGTVSAVMERDRLSRTALVSAFFGQEVPA
jgi:ribose transport system ATP-binding protein